MTHHSIKSLATALFKTPFYKAFINIFLYCPKPIQILRDYVLGSTDYPKEVRVRTPTGMQKLNLYCYADMLTFVECFGKEVYSARGDFDCVVDFGSNIGVSALYFLSRNASSRIYLYEPLGQNIERLKINLNGFEDRYELFQTAVGLENGSALFGFEPTGRYGGLKGGSYEGLLKTQKLHGEMEVPVRAANDILKEVLGRHDRVNILKVDIEGLEDDLLKNLEPALLDKVDLIYVESEFDGMLKGFRKKIYGGIARFSRS